MRQDGQGNAAALHKSGGRGQHVLQSGSKGHLVREIDALGGEMGINIDKTFIQSRMLNVSKGPAVHSLRAQADKRRYHEEMKKVLENQEHLLLKQGEAVDKESGKMVSLGDAVDQVAGKLGVKLPEGARKALDGMSGLSSGSVAAMGAIAAGVAAVIKVVKELNDLTLEAASRADDLMTQSITSGISTDLLQAYQYAAPYIDVSADTIVAANKKIGLSIASAVFCRWKSYSSRATSSWALLFTPMRASSSSSAKLFRRRRIS